MHKGILIAIEGIDGSGKDSQAQRLEEWISARGLNVFRFSFPTYTTPLGKVIQQALTESSFLVSSVLPNGHAKKRRAGEL
jgi:dTMP kinase